MLLIDPHAPLIFSVPATYSALSRAVKRGEARRFAQGVYSYDLAADPAQLLRAHWRQVTEHFCPGALIADRSAPRACPDEAGHLFVVHPRNRIVQVPGLTIIPRAGEEPLEDDIPLGMQPTSLRLSSTPRALVDNLRPSRSVKGRPRRTLDEQELHDWVARLLRTEGRDRLNQLRDRAREIADHFGMAIQFRTLDDVIGSALGTREVVTSSTALTAASAGLTYDERREPLFAALRDALLQRAPFPRIVGDAERARQRMLPFFEAYFSNFIEGTEFRIDEAAEIVLRGVEPAGRPADAHDIRGTFELVSDEPALRRRASSLDEWLELLRSRHRTLLRGRPERRPGEFKVRSNRAGSTEFVAPEHVIGTLARGLQHLSALEDPFARAVFVMFLVSEVHPFDDGNGRVARVMMNGELVSQSECRIIIPTVYRSEYLSGLKALTHNGIPHPLIRVLEFAQRYTAQLDCSSVEIGKQQLQATNAFVDPSETVERGLRLVLPSSLPR